MKIIQAGMGGWGRNWYQNYLSKFPGISVEAFVDQSEEMLGRVQQELKAPAKKCFRSLKEAMHSVKVEAVIITANLPGHVPLAREALSAGLHVLVEKPFAPSVRDAAGLVALAKRRKRVLMVSQNYRFFPAVRTVEQLIKAKKLGPVGSITIDFRKFANSAPRNGHKHYFIDHPLLIDMAIHQFDLLRCIAGGEPREVCCYGINPAWSNFQDPPAAFAVMKYRDGRTVSFRGSWISHQCGTGWAGDWAIECERGAITWSSRHTEDGRDDGVLLTQRGGTSTKVPLKKIRCLDRAGSVDAFIRAIRSGREPECSGRDNIGTLRLMNAMVRSAESGKPVRV